MKATKKPKNNIRGIISCKHLIHQFILICLKIELTLQEMHLIKYFDFKTKEYSHSINSVGKYYVITSQKYLYYSRRTGNFEMQKYEVPPSIKEFYAAAHIPEISALILAGNSTTMIIISFKKSSVLKILKTIQLDSHEGIHFKKIESIARIPNKQYYMASADNTSIAKIDYVSGACSYIKQHIDYVHSIAISPINYYLTSSTKGLLCLSDWTNGQFYYLFSTKNHIEVNKAIKINITVFIDFMPKRQYFVLSSTSDNSIFFFDGVYQRFFNRLSIESNVSCIVHIRDTSYFALSPSRGTNTLYYISIEQHKDFYQDQVSTKFFSLSGTEILSLDYEKRFVVWNLDARLCHWTCVKCTRPRSHLHCLKCAEGYHKKQGKCIKKCKKSLKMFNNKCLESCPVGFFEEYSGACSKCHSTCKECKGSSNAECIACEPGLHLRDQGACTREDCKKFNSILDESKTRCNKCFENCRTCRDTGEFNCTSCKPNHDFDYFDNTCKKKCVLHEYYNYSIGLCMRCPPNCIVCESSTSCTLCKVGTKLIKNKCRKGCLPGWFEVPYNGKCELCDDENCLRCPYSGRCKKCKDPYLLDEATSQCITHCKKRGFYHENKTSRCKKCTSGCKRCRSEVCDYCRFGYDKIKGVCFRRKNQLLYSILIALCCLSVCILVSFYALNKRMKAKIAKKREEKKKAMRKKEQELLAKTLMKLARRGESLERDEVGTLKTQEDGIEVDIIVPLKKLALKLKMGKDLNQKKIAGMKMTNKNGRLNFGASRARRGAFSAAFPQVSNQKVFKSQAERREEEEKKKQKEVAGEDLDQSGSSRSLGQSQDGDQNALGKNKGPRKSILKKK